MQIAQPLCNLLQCFTLAVKNSYIQTEFPFLTFVLSLSISRKILIYGVHFRQLKTSTRFSSFYFCRLKLSSVIIFYIMHSSPLTRLVILSGFQYAHLYWVAQNWTQYCKCSLMIASQAQYRLYFSYCRPVHGSHSHKGTHVQLVHQDTPHFFFASCFSIN